MNIDKAMDFCKFISQTHRTLFENRKSHEWRIFLSVMTFYSLTILYKLRNDNFEINGSFWACLIAYLVLNVISIVFFSLMHRANNINKSYAHNAEQAMQRLINEEENQSLSLFRDNYEETNSCFCKNIFSSLKAGSGGYWDVLIKSSVIILFSIASLIVLFS